MWRAGCDKRPKKPPKFRNSEKFTPATTKNDQAAILVVVGANPSLYFIVSLEYHCIYFQKIKMKTVFSKNMSLTNIADLRLKTAESNRRSFSIKINKKLRTCKDWRETSQNAS